MLIVLGCSKPVPQARPNVVLIVMDTTRADHLSLYGYDRDTTPYLASLAEEAIRFDHAYATSPWTVSSHASLFTGLLPVTHQATQENLRLDSELDTLAELLGGAGYETAAFTNNMWISKFTDLSRGFDERAGGGAMPPIARCSGGCANAIRSAPSLSSSTTWNRTGPMGPRQPIEIAFSPTWTRRP
jgi:hypothetical protein